MGHINKGFSIVEILLVIAIIAIFGFVGWKAYDTFFNNKTATTAQTQQVNTDTAPAVIDNSGLDASESTLNATIIDNSESAQLDAQTNF
jgi:prepilin-type N-terminal cleavage/methylation domain-containing protein